ncbi:MAG: aldo/keto reductase [Flavobacteriaceae bacterium]
MRYTFLPTTDIKVSKLCLGTMTFGNQNTEAEGHAQMDLAVERGINFFDTAELYPVPANATTYAETERILGSWFKKTGRRDHIVLASKIVGPGAYTAHIRDHDNFSPKHLREALENSLLRLQTDYLDLYQLHWPERKTNFFGVRGYKGQPENDPWKDNFEEILGTLADLIAEGKIKHIGLSNETPWGIMRYQQLAHKGFPKMITVQNPYNLLNRLFEVGNAEICLRENMGLLAYSPLGFGRLTGKYRGGMPENSRFKLFPNLARFNGENSILATEEYFKIASDFGISLTQMALAFVTDQPFVTSNIIGATNLSQLEENIASIDLGLSKELLKAIETVQEKIPNPAP